MSARRFIETIRVLNGELQLWAYHRERIERTLGVAAQAWLRRYEPEIRHFLASYQDKPLLGVYKLRFEYDDRAIYLISLEPYSPRRVERLIPTPISDIDCYRYKWADRSCLEAPSELRAELEQDPSAELIFTHQGLLTDTRYTNIVLDMGEGRLLTPERPLLSGVMRQHLLDEGRIQTAKLGLEELGEARAFYLINALMPLP